MLIGLCTSATANAKAISASTLDYIEENVQSFLAPEAADDGFAARRELARAAAKPIVAANCFFPGALKCVGPAVDGARLRAYAEQAFRRAGAAGIDTIVFGSGGSRQIPAEWPPATAFSQYVALLRDLGPLAERHRVTVVVEPLNRGECNLINTIEEGAEAVRQAAHPRIRLLADLYHMLRNDETPDAITRHGALLSHAHLAERETRSAPGMKGDDFRPFLRALRAVGYDRRMSLECGFGDLGSELADALASLRRQLADVGY